jgi:DNA-binding FrmR family transcriptional regulator
MDEHNHPHSKKVINRLARLIGHLEAVKSMAEDGRDCSEILTQIAAVMSALNGVGKLILEDHIRNCLLEVANPEKKEAIDKLLDAIDQYVGNHSRSLGSWH